MGGVDGRIVQRFWIRFEGFFGKTIASYFEIVRYEGINFSRKLLQVQVVAIVGTECDGTSNTQKMHHIGLEVAIFLVIGTLCDCGESRSNSDHITSLLEERVHVDKSLLKRGSNLLVLLLHMSRKSANTRHGGRRSFGSA